MDFSVDLRFSFPPLLNIIFFLFLKSQGQGHDNAWDQDVALNILQYPFLFILFLILALLLLLLFLLTPITIALAFSVNRLIFMDSGDYSFLLATSVLVSFILQPSFFSVIYTLLIIISPWHSQMWSLLKRFCKYIGHARRCLNSASWVNQNQENPEPAPVRVEEIEVEGNHDHIQNQPMLEEIVIGE